MNGSRREADDMAVIKQNPGVHARSINLRNIPDAELQAEIERRKAPAVALPQPLPNPDFSALIKMMETEKHESIGRGYEHKDFAHFVYEAAMTAVYGEGYFKWRNAQKWGG